MKKTWILLLAVMGCTSTQPTSVVNTQRDQATAATPVSIPDFVKVEHAYEVADVDASKMAEMKSKAEEISQYLGEVGSAYATNKGIVVTFERADIFGLAEYVTSSNSEQDYRKLVKSLKTFENGSVIVAGKTTISGNDAQAAERAKKVASFLSKKDIDKSKILIDEKGSAFENMAGRSAKVSNRDRVIEFLLVPPAG